MWICIIYFRIFVKLAIFEIGVKINLLMSVIDFNAYDYRHAYTPSL